MKVITQEHFEKIKREAAEKLAQQIDPKTIQKAIYSIVKIDRIEDINIFCADLISYKEGIGIALYIGNKSDGAAEARLIIRDNGIIDTVEQLSDKNRKNQNYEYDSHKDNAPPSLPQEKRPQKQRVIETGRLQQPGKKTNSEAKLSARAFMLASEIADKVRQINL